MEEIVFVTGCDCTRSWTNVAFLEGQEDAHASFLSRVVVDKNDGSTSINWHFSPERIRGALLNQGPEGKVCWCTTRAYESEVLLAHFRACRTNPKMGAYLSEGSVL